MKTTTTQALHTTAFTGLLTLTLLTRVMAADFSGNLKGVTITDSQAANKPPVATFTYTVSGETVTFDASGSSDSDGSVAEYKWDFGDGATGIGNIVNHTYSDLNERYVTLTVADNSGGIALTQLQLIINFAEIVDNADSSFSVTSGWSNSTWSPGYYGNNYVYAGPGVGPEQATWTFTVGLSGKYKVSGQWPISANADRAKNAQFQIINNEILKGLATVDLNLNGGQFNVLGTYELVSGTIKVTLANNVSGYMVADAIKLELTQ